MLNNLKDYILSITQKVPEVDPDFIVVGMTRSGTTYLYNILPQHLDIFLPKAKELNYFNCNRHYNKDLKGYAKLFRGYQGQKIYGEITPSYNEIGNFINDEGIVQHSIRKESYESPVERIARHFPDIKIIVTLRNPMSRLISLYSKGWYQRHIERPLQEELLEEYETEKSVMNLMFRQRYDLYLENIFKFIPHERVHIMIFEEWIKNQQKELNNLVKFLGLEPLKEWHPLTEEKQNKVSKYENMEELNLEPPPINIDAKTEVILKNTFKPVKNYVEQLLRRSVPWDI